MPSRTFGERVVGGVAGLGALYATTFGIALGIKHAEQNSSSDVLSSKRAALIADRRVASTDQALKATEIKVGNKCLKLVQAYSDGGVLHHEGFNASVRDIVSSPEQPCGQDPIQVGGELTSYRRDLQAQADAHGDSGAANTHLSKVTHNANRSFDTLVNSSLELSGIIDGGLLLFIGVIYFLEGADEGEW